MARNEDRAICSLSFLIVAFFVPPQKLQSTQQRHFPLIADLLSSPGFSCQSISIVFDRGNRSDETTYPIPLPHGAISCNARTVATRNNFPCFNCPPLAFLAAEDRQIEIGGVDCLHICCLAPPSTREQDRVYDGAELVLSTQITCFECGRSCLLATNAVVDRVRAWFEVSQWKDQTAECSSQLLDGLDGFFHFIS